MTQIPFLPKALRFLIILLIPFLLIIGSIRILTTNFYLAYEYNKTGFPPDIFGFNSAERFQLGSAGLKFVREPLPIGFLAGQSLKNQPVFNERELSHMQDVQNVFQMAWKAGLVILGIFSLSAILLGTNPRTLRYLASALQIGGFLAAGLIALIGILAIVGWEKWFTIFHTVFFLPGTWTFAFTDTLIRLYPMQFWFDSALTVFGIILIGGLATGFAGSIWKSRIGSTAR